MQKKFQTFQTTQNFSSPFSPFFHTLRPVQKAPKPADLRFSLFSPFFLPFSLSPTQVVCEEGRDMSMDRRMITTAPSLYATPGGGAVPS